MTFGQVAANFAATAKPVAPMLDGFEAVLSNEATKQLSQIPLQNAAMNLALAQSGLTQVGAMAQQRLLLDLERERLADNVQQRRSARRSDALRMAGQLFSSALPALGGGGAAAAVNPFGLMTSMDGLWAAQAQSRATRSAGSRGVAASALSSLF